jgi:hypothetical protein
VSGKADMNVSSGFSCGFFALDRERLPGALCETSRIHHFPASSTAYMA